MSNSIHTSRWISQITDQGWDIHLFPCMENVRVHPELKKIKIHNSILEAEIKTNILKNIYGFEPLVKLIQRFGSLIVHKIFPNFQVYHLQRVIQRTNPDIIHSLEFQHSAYLTLEAKHIFKDTFPPWIVTNWGSDIYLYGRIAEHEQKIRDVLASCDFYSCECNRDVNLAREYGYKGIILPVFPNTGGFDLEKIWKWREAGPTSKRRLIMLKGYNGWVYRALVGLRALERSADLLKGYTICIYSANSDVQIAAELFIQSTGIPVKIIPQISHDEMLKLHGKSRISIGLSISDSISTSFLEALVMGSFPIQSWTSCANEWIEDGITGILVPPDDPDIIEKAIRHALTDDNLVNQAAEKNMQTAITNLDQRKIKMEAIDFYERVNQA